MSLKGGDDKAKAAYLALVGPTADISSAAGLQAFKDWCSTLASGSHRGNVELDATHHLLPANTSAPMSKVLSLYLGSAHLERLSKNKRNLAAVTAKLNLRCLDPNVGEFLSCVAVEPRTSRLGAHAFATHSVDGWEECALKCTRDTRCESWQFSSAAKTADCRLFGQVGGARHDGPSHTAGVNLFNVLDKYVGTGNGTVVDKSWTGPAFARAPLAPPDCANKCAADERCVAWVWRPVQGDSCSLLGSLGQHKDEAGVVSGLRVLADGNFRYSVADALRCRRLLADNEALETYNAAYRAAIRDL